MHSHVDRARTRLAKHLQHHRLITQPEYQALFNSSDPSNPFDVAFSYGTNEWLRRLYEAPSETWYILGPSPGVSSTSTIYSSPAQAMSDYIEFSVELPEELEGLTIYPDGFEIQLPEQPSVVCSRVDYSSVSGRLEDRIVKAARHLRRPVDANQFKAAFRKIPVLGSATYTQRHHPGDAQLSEHWIASEEPLFPDLLSLTDALAAWLSAHINTPLRRHQVLDAMAAFTGQPSWQHLKAADKATRHRHNRPFLLFRATPDSPEGIHVGTFDGYSSGLAAFIDANRGVERSIEVNSGYVFQIYNDTPHTREQPFEWPFSSAVTIDDERWLLTESVPAINNDRLGIGICESKDPLGEAKAYLSNENTIKYRMRSIANIFNDPHTTTAISSPDEVHEIVEVIGHYLPGGADDNAVLWRGRIKGMLACTLPALLCEPAKQAYSPSPDNLLTLFELDSLVSISTNQTIPAERRYKLIEFLRTEFSIDGANLKQRKDTSDDISNHSGAKWHGFYLTGLRDAMADISDERRNRLATLLKPVAANGGHPPQSRQQT